MKAVALVPILATMGAPAASAAPCVSDTLAGYIGLGAGGCEIGAASFSGFATFGVPFGSTPVAAGDVLVDPLTDDPARPGLAFQLDLDASLGEIFEIVIGYQVSAPSLVLARLEIEGSNVTPDGAVTGVEDLCLDGFFDPGGPTGCTGSPLVQIVYDVGFDELLVEELAFGPVAALAVILDLAVDSGPEGAAELLLARTRFELAEPGTALLFAAGSLALALRRRSRPN